MKCTTVFVYITIKKLLKLKQIKRWYKYNQSKSVDTSVMMVVAAEPPPAAAAAAVAAAAARGSVGERPPSMTAGVSLT